MRYLTERAVIQISAEELCELAYRSGNPLFSNRRRKLSVSPDFVEKLKFKYGDCFQTGQELVCTHQFRGIAYEIKGKPFAVVQRSDQFIVAEPCSDRVHNPIPERMLAHLRLTAWLAAKHCEKKEVNCCLFSRSEEKEVWETCRETLPIEWLTAFLERMLTCIQDRAMYMVTHETEMRPTLASVPFPYSSMREGQEFLIRECYRDIRHGKRLFVQAPTGIGKTLSTLYPALRALGNGIADRIFYLTAKASARGEAFRAAEQLHFAGAKFKTIVLHAKEQMCINSDRRDMFGTMRRCIPEQCPYLKEYYERSRRAVAELRGTADGYTDRLIRDVARKYHICPYELSLDLSESCDLIICDYNYVFDPLIKLQRYFGEGADPEWLGNGKNIFLVDEAHNLADRAREMLSSELRISAIYQICAMAGGESAFDGAFSGLLREMRKFKSLCHETLERDEEGEEYGYYVTHGRMDSFLEVLEFCVQTAEKWRRTHRSDPLRDAMEDILALLRRFVCIGERYDRNYLTYAEVRGKEILLRLTCLDPSLELHAAMSRAVASVLFSATLTPTSYFCDILGGGKQAVTVSLPSPFSKEHLFLAAIGSVSTRYADRDKSYRKVATCIAATVSGKKGNYMVYFPSYQYLEQVYRIFSEKYPGVETVIQTHHMSMQEKEKFLNSFRVPHKTMRVGFCVLGGSFSEGIDLPGDFLIGSVIVGVGLPGLSSERNILREYYDERNGNEEGGGTGYDYAYTYPGMNQVLQASGRVIRREQDKGIVVLIDDRYLTPQYRALYPEHWSEMREITETAELAKEIREFWEKIDHPKEEEPKKN